MKITSKQAHVLANLNRVIPLSNHPETLSSRDRFQLDGVDCTDQITALTVHKLIWKKSDGFGRRKESAAYLKRNQPSERQPPMPSAMESIRASLSPPAGTRSQASDER